MINQELMQLVKAVDKINSELADQLYSEKYGMDPAIAVEINHVTVQTNVMFLDTCIWNSEDDPREWIEEVREDKINEDLSRTFTSRPAHYEPIEPYLRNKINELVTKIGKIKL